MEPIHAAVVSRDQAAIRWLVQESPESLHSIVPVGGDEINVDENVDEDEQRYINGMLPLAIAALAGYEEVTALLLELGAQVNERNTADEQEESNDWTAGHWACFYNEHGTLKLLLDAGASMTLRGFHNDTLLDRALEYGATECVELLLSRGSDPNLADDAGCTVLHRYAHWTTSPLLLRFGADPTIKNNDSQTPLELEEGGLPETVAVLRAALTELARPRLLFKARALLDAEAAIAKARKNALDKAGADRRQTRGALNTTVAAAAPPYLTRRVAAGQELPRLVIGFGEGKSDQGGGDKEQEEQEEQEQEQERVAASVRFALGLPQELFTELMGLLVPPWDPARRDMPLGQGVVEVEATAEELAKGNQFLWAEDVYDVYEPSDEILEAAKRVREVMNAYKNAT